MVFSSYIFIFAFLPLVLLGFYLLPRLIAAPGRLRKAQNLLLIAASLVFYGYFNVSYLLLIAASILVNYLLALAIQNGRRQQLVKLCFVVGVLFNVLLIGYFKYYDFFIENINFLFRGSFALKHLLLPLGISFSPSSSFPSWCLYIRKKSRWRTSSATACLCCSSPSWWRAPSCSTVK